MTLRITSREHNYSLTRQLQYLSDMCPVPGLSLRVSLFNRLNKDHDLLSNFMASLPEYLDYARLLSIFCLDKWTTSPPRLKELLKLSIQKTENYDDAGGWRWSQ